jgi:hypothetical protein
MEENEDFRRSEPALVIIGLGEAIIEELDELPHEQFLRLVEVRLVCCVGVLLLCLLLSRTIDGGDGLKGKELEQVPRAVALLVELLLALRGGAARWRIKPRLRELIGEKALDERAVGLSLNGLVASARWRARTLIVHIPGSSVKTTAAESSSHPP